MNTSKMKAVVFTNYGPPSVLQYQEVEKPQPKEGEVLIKVKATTVSTGELKIRGFRDIPMLFWLPLRMSIGLFKPKVKILGCEFAGEIVGMGSQVSSFKLGDQVFGFHMFGTNAEYFCMPAKAAIATMPQNMTCEQAATIPFGSLTALDFLQKAKLKRGDRILINGASGLVGSDAIQLAKYYGAHVTAVGGTKNVALMKELGADIVIDYKKEDFTQNGQLYDIIFDVASKSTFFKCKNSLKKNGRYLRTAFKGKDLLIMLWTTLFGHKKAICAVSTETKEKLEYLRNIIEEGKLISLVKQQYTLAQTADVHDCIERGKRQGKAVILPEL